MTGTTDTTQSGANSASAADYAACRCGKRYMRTVQQVAKKGVASRFVIRATETHEAYVVESGMCVVFG